MNLTTNSFNNNESPRPVLIDPQAGKSRLPKWIIWLLSCLGGCFVLSLLFVFALSSLLTLLISSSSVSINENIITDSTSASNSKIAVIPVSGVIVDESEGQNLLNISNTTSSSSINKLLDTALNDKYVQAIVLRENTPGGSTLAMRKICEKIKLVDKTKSVYTYIESEGASAGYYIANCTRYIIADKQAITGSIGALIEVTDIQGLLDKLGIKTKVITNTQGTQKQSDLFDQNSKDEKKLKTILDEAYDDFIKQVVQGRNNPHLNKTNKLTEDQIKSLATGEIFSGKQALANGLIDENNFFEDSIHTVIKRESLSSDIKVIQYQYSGGFLFNMSSSLKQLIGLKSEVSISFSALYSIRK